MTSPPVTTTEVGARRLEVHVINAGVGESIVVRMPDDTWGVVDCYSPSVSDPESNPTRRFLLNRGVQELAFLCLTHPHDDHYRGMSHLLKTFTTKLFWQPGAMSAERLFDLVNYLKEDAAERSDAEEQESATDLQTTLALVRQRRKAGQLRLMHMQDIKPLYPVPIRLGPPEEGGEVPFRILSIAPSADCVTRYEEGLRHCFATDRRLKLNPPRLRHNQISAALLICFGTTRVILGGDVDAASWRDTLNVLDSADLAAHGVKVSHHGSVTGYTANLWGVFAARGKPVAVITPFRRYGLPRRDAVEHIRSHCSQLLVTCLPAVPFAARPFDFSNSYPLSVQSHLREAFTAYRIRRDNPLGICSLTFDDQGNCTDIRCEDAAGPLELP